MRSSIRTVLAAAIGSLMLAGCGGGGGDNKGILSFTSLSYSVTENGAPLNVITVQRLGGDGEVGCTLVTSDGTATAGADYVATSITLIWPAGDLTSKTVEIPILQDHADEPGETLTLSLTDPTGGATIRHPLNDATLNIVDDDVAGAIQFDTTQYFFFEDGTPFGGFVTVTRVGGQDGDVSAHIVTHDGTATADPQSAVEPVDYYPFTTTVTFADQDTTPVMVPLTGVIRQDLLPEPAEDFMLEIINPTGGATVGVTSPATVSIIDDDQLLTIPNPDVGSLFGATVAKLGSRLLIGAPGNGGGSGRMYVFDPSDGTLVDTISRPASMQLGSAVSAGATTVAIGSQGKVWALDADTRADRYVLTSALPGFGQAILVLGDGRLVVGAPQTPPSGGSTAAGAALVYDELTGAPLQTVAGTGDMRLGASLARLGSDLLIGAPGGAGAVLQFAGEPFVLGATLDNPVPESPSPGFGSTILTIDLDSSIYVGAPDADAPGHADAGRLSLFSPAGDTSATPAVTNARFGSALLALTDFILVHAPNDGPSGSGRVYGYDKSLSFPFLQFDDPNPTAGAGYGAAMCEFDGSIVIAAPHQDVGGAPDRGAVYVIKLF